MGGRSAGLQGGSPIPWLLRNGRPELLRNLLLTTRKRMTFFLPWSFGPRVTDPDRARELMKKIGRETEELFGGKADLPSWPELRMTHKMSQLGPRCLQLVLLFLTVNLVLAGLTLMTQGSESGWGFILTVMLILQCLPLVICRRVGLNVEHRCLYVREHDGHSHIEIDELREVKFQSFLAHELAHHLIFEYRAGANLPAWQREGSARLLQLGATRSLEAKEGNPAFTHHVRQQILGELKYAYTLVLYQNGRKPPWRIRWLRTIFHRNPLVCLVTGSPGFDPQDLGVHALGTAVAMILERQHGLEIAVRKLTMESDVLSEKEGRVGE